jgi:signal transduction histidine kinase
VKVIIFSGCASPLICGSAGITDCPESSRLKTAFLNNVSHEIRTPLNATLGFSGFLNYPDLSAEKRKYFTEIITKSSEQLLGIIENI